MTITRVRVLTPEALDAAAANLVNTPTSQLGIAVSTLAGSGSPVTTGVVAATPSTLMQRDASGRSQVATPSVSADIAPKGYVDTTVSAYVLTSAKGAVSGVASLDSSGFVPANQISAVFPRNLGSGTSFPGSKNTGDIFTHTGLGCLMRWDGNIWQQAGRATVASRAARDTLLSAYGSVMPTGFRLIQTNFGWIWRKDATGWVYAGVEAGSSIWAETANVGPSFKYTRLNLSIASGATITPTAWTFEQAGSSDTEREIIQKQSDGSFKIFDRCALSIVCEHSTDWANAGQEDFKILVPGGAKAAPGGAIQDTGKHLSGYAGSGVVVHTLSWTGYANANDSFSAVVHPFIVAGAATVHNFALSVSLLPS